MTLEGCAALGMCCALIACSSTARTPSPASGGGLNLDLPPPVNCADSGVRVPAPMACINSVHRDFESDVVPLFSDCGGEICHSFASGGIADQIGVLATECCDQIPVIDPGHPESSYLLNKLSGQGLCDGVQMPIGRTPFSESDLRVINDWICQGANTNR